MRIARTSRTTAALALAASVLFVAAGCSTDGTVKITNRSGTQFLGSIDNRGFALSGNESIEFTIQVGDQFLFFGPDSKDVPIEGESCTRFPFTGMVSVRGDDITTFTIQPDAACLVFENEVECELDQIYMREVGTSDWGDNLAVRELEIGEVEQLRVLPGIYQYLLIDTCGDSTETVEPDTVLVGRSEFVRHVP